jgi:hypothetical protein
LRERIFRKNGNDPRVYLVGKILEKGGDREEGNFGIFSVQTDG